MTNHRRHNNAADQIKGGRTDLISQSNERFWIDGCDFSLEAGRAIDRDTEKGLTGKGAIDSDREAEASC